MQGRQGKTLDAGRRAQGFLDAEATAIGSAVSKALRAKLAQFEVQPGLGRIALVSSDPKAA